MSDDWQEKQLRERFQELKREEAVSAPSFSVTCAEAYSKKKAFNHAIYKWRLATATVVALLLAIGSVFLLQRPRPQTTGTTVVALSNWRSPTDWLLETPDRQLLRDIPRLGEPLMKLNVNQREGTTK